MATLKTYFFSAIGPVVDGTADQAGAGEKWSVSFAGGAPAAGDGFSVQLVDSLSSTIIQVGEGDTTHIAPTFCLSFGGKEYLIAGSNVYFSALNDPVTWNDPEGIGNGFVSMLDTTNTPEDIVAASPFQGRLAFFARNSVQIWIVPTDPTQWSLVQTLNNIGTIAPASVVPRGNLDVLFLADTGVRSLRARETTLNAFVDDVGSPIDEILQPLIAGNQSAAAAACSIVDPVSGNYWMYFNGVIYVLSYYPSSKIAAWATYEPKDNAGSTFVPTKFIVYKGQVYARAGNKVYQYGGSNRFTYDSTSITWQTSYLDLKSPGTRKSAKMVNVACKGTWAISVGQDPISGTLESNVYTNLGSSFDIGSIPLQGYGSHVTFKGVSSGTLASTPIRFSALVFHYEEGEDQ